MATRPSINARQRQVLQRIVDGAEPVTRADSALVTTVNALANRKLVTKQRGPRGRWSAEATDLGRAALGPPGPTSTTSDAGGHVLDKNMTHRPAKGPKVFTLGGQPIVEAVRLPARWPAVLQPTVDALQSRGESTQQRFVAHGEGLASININRELRTRTLQLLWLFAQNLATRQIPWVRITSVPIRMNEAYPDEGHRLGTLALGTVEAPLFVALNEVGWWRPDPAGRVGVKIGSRTWSERRLSDGRHSIDVETALGDIEEMLEKGRLLTVRQQEAEARDRELDARYAVERERALDVAAVNWQIHDATERGLADAEGWEKADRLRRFAEAIDKAHPKDKRWQDYRSFLAVRAYALDPLNGEPPVVMAEVPEEHLYRMSVRWPEKRPSYWEPSPDRPRRRRRR